MNESDFTPPTHDGTTRQPAAPELPPLPSTASGKRADAPTRTPVDVGTATLLVARALVGTIAPRGRLLALGGFSIGIVAIAALVARNQSGSSPAAALSFTDVTMYGIALPLFVLFAAAAGLGEANTEGTLVYLWLRPIPRASIAVGAWMTTAATATPFTTATSALIPLVFGAGARTVIGAMVAGLIATWAYAALFSLLGALTRFSTPIGLAYILVWESVIGRLGSLTEALTIHHYAISIAAGIARVRVSGGIPNALFATTVLLLATVAILALTTLRLGRMNVR